MKLRVGDDGWREGKAGTDEAAFALKDLTALLAMLALLSLLILPASGGNRTASKAALCLGNLRQLTLAWQLYAEDANGNFVHNYHGGDAVGGAAGNNPRNSPWALGWLDWTTSSDITNRLLIQTRKYARLAPYLEAESKVHKCPADFWVSKHQRESGFKERVRSVVMNGTIGDGNGPIGPWDPLYRQAKNYAQLILPSPAESMVFLDEHPDSINDPLFFAPKIGAWIDWPGNHHHGAGGVSFADGHVEMHSWAGPARSAPVRFGAGSPVTKAGDPDLEWVRYRSQRVKDL